MSTTTSILQDDFAVGDYVIVQQLHRSRVALKVDKIGDDRRYIFGRTFSIATFERDGMVAFNGRTKLVSLRPTTSIERIVPGS